MAPCNPTGLCPLETAEYSITHTLRARLIESLDATRAVLHAGSCFWEEAAAFGKRKIGEVMLHQERKLIIKYGAFQKCSERADFILDSICSHCYSWLHSEACSSSQPFRLTLYGSWPVSSETEGSWFSLLLLPIPEQILSASVCLLTLRETF